MLTLLAALPLVGAVLTVVLPARARPPVGLVFALAALGLAGWATAHRDTLSESVAWIPQIGARYALRLDGLATLLVLVSALLVVAVLVTRLGKSTWPTFVPLALALEGVALLTFMADDVLLFFIAFEATLVPMYFLIGAGGKPRRSAAALKFLIYSLAGGLLLLGGIVYLASFGKGLGYSQLATLSLDPTAERALFLAFFVSFAVKAPLVPLHPWLPDAVEHGRPASSVLLVGLLDGIGLFGMVRFCVGLTPHGAAWAAAGISIAALVTVVYGALAAVATRSLLRLAAFASISHAGFMVLGLFAFTSASVNGSLVYVGAHAISASALILAVGWAVARRGDTLGKGAFGGLARRAPVLAGVFLLAGLATLALPGSANFAAELSIIVGAWGRHPVLVAVALIGVLAAGVYVLWAYQRVFTGEPAEAEEVGDPGDIGWPSRLGIGIMLVVLLAFGVHPSPAQHLVAGNTNAAMSAAQMSDPQEGH